jgi:GTP-binding protein LepA
MENDLTIIPVLNKIDLPSSDVERVSEEVMNLLGCTREEIIPVSAKTGENVETILDAVLERIPEPKHLTLIPSPQGEGGTETCLMPSTDPSSLKERGQGGEVYALIFDSQYDPYKGVVVYLKLFSGEIRK